MVPDHVERLSKVTSAAIDTLAQEAWSLQLADFLLFHQGLHPIGWCLLHSAQVSFPQLLSHMSIIFGNALTDTPRGVLY
jgi:hypothetical protein